LLLFFKGAELLDEHSPAITEAVSSLKEHISKDYPSIAKSDMVKDTKVPLFEKAISEVTQHVATVVSLCW